MSAQATSVEYQSDVAATDPVAFSQLDLRDDAFQGAYLCGLPQCDPACTSMSEGVAAMRLGPEMIHSDAVLLLAPMVDHESVGDGAMNELVGHPMCSFTVGGLPVSPWGDEALPDVTWGIESPVLGEPRLGQASVVALQKSEGLPRNPSASGVCPGSDGRGISAPTLTKVIAHNVEVTTMGGV
jgi:hypothetical protein